MNLSEYILLPKEERQLHINLESPCILPKVKREWGMEKARLGLLNYLSLTKDISGRKANCCHLCPNHSRSGGVCVNPLHLYFGTPSENQYDIPDEVRKPRMEKMLSAALSIRTPEYNREWNERMQEVLKSKTFEERSISAKKGAQRKTPEERSEISRKGWETRRKNQLGSP